MPSKLLLFICLLLSVHCFSQQDFLQLKKRNKTIETFFKGSYVTFQTDGYQWLTGRIFKVANDSVFLYQIEVQMKPNQYGLGTVADTTVFGLVALSIKNFYAIPNEHQSYAPKLGLILQAGALSFIGLNIVNTAINKAPLFDDRNKKRLGGALVAFIAGKLLQRSSPAVYKLGKKYKLVYVKLNG